MTDTIFPDGVVCNNFPDPCSDFPDGCSGFQDGCSNFPDGCSNFPYGCSNFSDGCSNFPYGCSNFPDGCNIFPDGCNFSQTLDRLGISYRSKILRSVLFLEYYLKSKIFNLKFQFLNSCDLKGALRCSFCKRNGAVLPIRN